jgi:hypothetical protein
MHGSCYDNPVVACAESYGFPELPNGLMVSLNVVPCLSGQSCSIGNNHVCPITSRAAVAGLESS